MDCDMIPDDIVDIVDVVSKDYFTSQNESFVKEEKYFDDITNYISDLGDVYVNVQDTVSTPCEYYEGFPEVPSIDRDSWTSDSTGSSNLTQKEAVCASEIAINQHKVEDVSSNTPDTTEMTSYKRTSMLPPCRICHEKASGLHYGVNTCEACKGFFRRSINRATPYKCIGDGNCVIGPRRRSSCPYCRYKKCKEAGMAKSAIKTGRYTHEVRSKNILEVKQLEEKSRVAETEVNHNQEIETMIAKIVMAQNQIQSDVDETCNDEKQIQRLKEYQIKCRLRSRKLETSMEDTTNWQQTDNCHEDYKEDEERFIVEDMELGIRRVVNFSKLLPGFSSLAVEDQASLIRAFMHESWLISSSRCYNKDLGLISGPLTFHFDTVRTLFGEEMQQQTFRLLERINELCLTKEEMAVFRAICITSGGRGLKLKNPGELEKINWKYLECFRHLCHKRGLQFDKRLPKVVDVMISMRDCCDLFSSN
ncbi:hypothetical protein CHS0354_040743 [Potamilus streckersoni]|uniref:Uncharacterized protein n=1 Tax=Potamilus streckersoni TaxID=2493646 RepID=A0AAE0SLC2_9BIVA|nr:hypothetical protein CHS0354_040743 [Potamilus streckersoni]